MRHSVWAILALVAAAPVHADENRLAKAWQELFAQERPPEATKELEAVLAAVGNDAAKLKSLLDADKAYAPLPAGWRNQAIKVSDGQEEREVAFALRVPRDYGKSPERPWPLLLLAHGPKSSGQEIGLAMEKRLGEETKKYILLCPTLPGPQLFTGSSFQERAFLEPLAWARVHMNVDDDRICLAGYGMGGNCAWHLATMYPHLFAAAAPMAGTPWFEASPYTNLTYLENLAHLPIWAIWGEKDAAEPPALGTVDYCRAARARLLELKNDKFVGTEIPGAGQSDCWPKGADLVKFLGSVKREICPRNVVHVFHLAHHRRGYYLEATELSHPPIDFMQKMRLRIQTSGDPKQADWDRAVSEYMQKFLFRLWGELNGGDNALTVRAASVKTIRVYVAEGMFDLSKPVTVRFWSKSWSGRVPASAQCMLQHYAATRDATAPIYNEIDLEFNGKVTVRYK